MKRVDILASLRRLGFVVLIISFLSVLSVSAEAPAGTFSLDDVVTKARTLSAQPYQDMLGIVPDWLIKINYDQHRDIRFIPAKSHWRSDDLPFELQFFHLGLYFDRPVHINEVGSDGVVAPIHFNRDMYIYEKTSAELRDRVPDDLGFAGFRIHYNLNNSEYKDEIAVFLGASYFRAVAKDQVYGLSARGLSVDTWEMTGEEFPWFREFWVQRPQKSDKTITVYALLDSPRITGAYKYVITPGAETTMDVESTLFLRAGIKKVGVAPMTSMFFYGETTNLRPKDWFRPEIHDSDGIMVHMDSGEWLWRPLSNSPNLWVNAFQANNPQGFGLINRDLEFDHYQDLEAHYERRPSLWCEPKGQWGDGSVELVQQHTDDEIHDNIVAYWRPANTPVGQPLSFNYRLRWYYPNNLDGFPPAGRVVATRIETDPAWQTPETWQNRKKFVLDFEGEELAKLIPENGVTGAVTTGTEGAEILEQQVYKNRATGGWRFVFDVKMADGMSGDKNASDKRAKRIVELRAFLKQGNSILTETWSYAAEI